MAELFDMKELEERVILVAVSTSDEDDTEASLDELEELADTAGATAIGRLVQMCIRDSSCAAPEKGDFTARTDAGCPVGSDSCI